MPRLSTLSVFAAAAGVAVGECQPLSQKCCSQLKQASGLADKVYFPDSEAYEGQIDSYWSVSAALPAWCMVLPESAKDVSTVIKTITKNECPFGIRGGGHGAHTLSNAVENGVTIDFGHINTTSYNEETKLASVPPGSHWQDVYDTLAPYGVAVTGGRAGTVGTGGFISGGGNSFHSASHGFAADNVANFEVVLADGSIVNANATSHPDLWVALKGGSGSFGLITRFDMYTIEYANEENSVWGGNLFYELEKGDEVIDALVDFTDNVYKDENSSSIVYWAYLPKALGGTIINAAIENTKAAVKPAAFDGYYALEPYQDGTKVDTLSNVANELGSGQPSGYRNVWFTASFKNDARAMRYAVEKYTQLNKDLEAVAPSNTTDLNTLCMFQPITKSIVEKSIARGGNVMGLEDYIEDGNGIMFLVTLALNGKEYEDKAYPLMEAYLNDLEEYTTSIDAHWDWKYLNYAHLSQDVYASYGSKALATLQKASTKYDPTGVFQKLRGSGFKLPPYSSVPGKEL